MQSRSLGLLNCLEFIGGLHPFWLVLEHFIKIIYRIQGVQFDRGQDWFTDSIGIPGPHIGGQDGFLSHRGPGGVALLGLSSSHAPAGVHSSVAGFGGRCSLLLVEFLNFSYVFRVEELTHKERVLTFFTKLVMCPRPVGCVQHGAFVGIACFGALASRARFPPISVALHLLVDHEGGVLEDLHILLAAVRIVIVQHCVQLLAGRRGNLHVTRVLRAAPLVWVLILESSLGVSGQASLEI